MSAHGGVAAPVPDMKVRKPRMDLARRFVQGDLVELRVVLVLVVIWAVFQMQEPRFLTATNLTNLVLQITAIGLISVGIVMVLCLGRSISPSER